ncbi:MAG: hypothetical protein OWT27_08130 [Firmicutes bacterium]|nr:hypothetical protein [Bacillota bacterium]
MTEFSVVGGWILFVASVLAAGWSVVAMIAPTLPLWESIGTGFVAGSALLPFALFAVDAVLRLRDLAYHGDRILALAGALIAIAIITAIAIRRSARQRRAQLHSVATRGQHRSRSRGRRVRSRLRQAPWDTVFTIVFALAIAAFFAEVVRGAVAPLFGWDEYSYWLYAAKVLSLHGGAIRALRHYDYGSYPPAFPYLCAWLYQLLGYISIHAARFVTPILVLFLLLAIHRALVRLGLRTVHATMAVAMIAWGTSSFYWYTVLAFGEMAFVAVYALALLYLAAWWMSARRQDPHARSDWRLFALFFGLSGFLRVDGLYIECMTVVIVAVFLAMRKDPRPRLRQWLELAVLGLVPPLSWYAYRALAHVRAGWVTRISLQTLAKRLEPPFVTQVLAAMWHDLSSLQTYPIMLVLVLTIIAALITRNRLSLLLCTVAVFQAIYLFVAYVTVFTAFEAVHASSLDRYMLRDDPLTAIACALLFLPTISPGTRREKRRPGSRRRRPSESGERLHEG